jgi:hypothetical protein
MRPSTPWRAWAARVVGVGPSRLALAISVVLVLVSLALPVWSLSVPVPNGHDISSYSWTTVTTDRYRGGAWDGTEILPYTSTQFTFRAVAAVAATGYILIVVLFIVLAVVLALFSTDYGQLLPTLTLLILSLVILGVALLALFFPLVAVPGAATTDVGTFTIGGFWGSASRGPAGEYSWGPGLGWWILLVATVLGVLGAVLPYLKSVSAMMPPPPPPRE